MLIQEVIVALMVIWGTLSVQPIIKPRMADLYSLGTKQETQSTPTGKRKNYYRSQKGVSSSYIDIDVLYQLKKIHQSTTGAGVKVGIIESGGYIKHPDIKRNFKRAHHIKMKRYDTHGTGVSSIISHIAPNVRLKIFPRLHKRSHADILNVSRDFRQLDMNKSDTLFNMPFYKTLMPTFQTITQSGTLITKSSGNSGQQILPSLVRFAEEETQGRMILVGSLDYQGGRERRASFATYGHLGKHPMICAPGQHMLVAQYKYTHGVDSGTSFSAPIVSGALALLMETYPQWKKTHPEKYIDFILRSARQNPNIGSQCGRGILDIQAALKEAFMEVILEKMQQIIVQTQRVDWASLKAIIQAEHPEIPLKELKSLLSTETLLPLFIVKGYTQAVLFLLHGDQEAVNKKVVDPRYKKILALDPNAQLFTPLELAIQSFQSSLVETLLEQGATSPFESSESDFCLLKLKTIGPKTEKLLWERATQHMDNRWDAYGRNLLMVASYYKAPERILKALLKVNRSSDYDSLGYTAIDWAIMGNNEAGFDFLIKNQNVNETNSLKGNISYLHVAAGINNGKIVEKLLQMKAHIEARDFQGNTPLHMAAGNDHVDIVQTLLQKGANINAKNADDQSPLGYAVLLDAKESTEFLIQRGANINDQDNTGFTPLHRAVQSNSIYTLKLLLKKGSPIETLNYLHRTPLHYAAKYNAVESLQILLKRGADMEAQDVDGYTPLHMAAQGSDTLESLKLLLKNGANIKAQDKKGATPLHHAASNLHGLYLMAALIKGGAAINGGDKMGATPLHYGRSQEAIKVLLKNGAKVDEMTKEKSTPLHWATIQNQVHTIKTFIENHASINAQDNLGMTPLHLAAFYNAPQAIEYLLAQKADPSLKDKYGRTPLDIAKEHRAFEAINRLKAPSPNPSQK